MADYEIWIWPAFFGIRGSCNDINARWQTFVKPVKKPQGKKQSTFHNAQAAARKDVERAFGILQTQFAIVRGPDRFSDQEIL